MRSDTKLARLWKEFQNNWDIYIIILGSITVGIISFFLSTVGKTDIPTVLSLTLTILGLVAISLRRDRHIDTKTEKSLEELSEKISLWRENRAFNHQHDAYMFLIDEINKHGVKEAVFLQYSCQTSKDVLRTVLRKGAKVTVFLQHEDMAERIGSHYQVNRIKRSIQELRVDLSGSLPKPENLKVYKYRVLASVSGIKLDNRVLCMGWYVYKYIDEFSSKEMANDDVELLGHNIAALVVWKGTDEFEAFDKMFRMLEKNYQKKSEEVPVQ